MKYMGSKSSIAKYILPIILKDRKDGQYYVEPFSGGMNMIDKVSGLRIAGDFNYFLIEMWKALKNGWNPPKFISRDQYNFWRDRYNNGAHSDPHIIGYIGFCGSYGGRFFDGGYAGKTITKNGLEIDYPLEAYNNVMRQLPYMRDVDLNFCDYRDCPIPDGSIVYCDPPYKGTKQYKNSIYFDHNSFWNWVREKSKKNIVFVSEYEAPDDFECIWSMEKTSSLRANGNVEGSKKSIEKLFKIKDSK